MRKYLSFVVVAAAAALVACGGGVETGGSAGASSSSSSSGAGGSGSGGSGAGGTSGVGGGAPVVVKGEATTIHDCAPNDAPLLTLKIGLPEKTCTSTPLGPLLVLSFGTHLDVPAGNTWDFANGADAAHGVYQPDGVDPSNVIAVVAGTLKVVTWDMVAATGTYDVLLVDGTHLAGSFDALACLQQPAFCG